MFHYKFETWRAALAQAARTSPLDPRRGVRLEFTNPSTGGSVMPTISAFCQFMPKGFVSAPARSTDGAIYVVVEGAGRVRVGEEQFELAPRNVFVAPPWAPLVVEAEEDVVLFSYSDRAAQERLGLWRADEGLQ